MSKLPPREFLKVGKIVKPHGLKGEVKILLFAQADEALSNGVRIWLRYPGGQTLDKVLESCQLIGPHPRLKLEGISNRDDAESLRDCEILSDRRDLPVPEEDDYYLTDLIGLRVWDENNNYLGDIRDAYALPANDVIALDYKGKEVLIPMIDEIITLIDFENKTVRIHLMEGLLDL